MQSRGLLTELLGRPTRESIWFRLLGWVVRARAELTVLTVLVSVDVLLISYTGLPARGCALIEFGGLAAVVAVPPVWRYLGYRMWAVSDRHRIWACLTQTRTMTPDGKMPLLCWSRPSPVGERVHVWLPAGLSVNDVDNITEALAAACYAAQARVEVNRKWTHLAVITIVRRDPLTGRKLVRPNYGAHVPSAGSDGAFAPLPDRDLIPTPTPPAQHPTVTGMKTAGGQGRPIARRAPTGSNPTATKPTNDEPTTPPPVVGVGGMDVSDYV
jgi:hypothetical protein